MTHLSGHLKETLMRVYDIRPSIAKELMEIIEHISNIEKREYAKGYAECLESIVKCEDCKFHTEDDECKNPHWDGEESVTYPSVYENDFCSYGERK